MGKATKASNDISGAKKPGNIIRCTSGELDFGFRISNFGFVQAYDVANQYMRHADDMP
jgi:hypothetical protein